MMPSRASRGVREVVVPPTRRRGFSNGDRSPSGVGACPWTLVGSSGTGGGVSSGAGCARTRLASVKALAAPPKAALKARRERSMGLLLLEPPVEVDQAPQALGG